MEEYDWSNDADVGLGAEGIDGYSDQKPAKKGVPASNKTSVSKSKSSSAQVTAAKPAWGGFRAACIRHASPSTGSSAAPAASPAGTVTSTPPHASTKAEGALTRTLSVGDKGKQSKAKSKAKSRAKASRPEAQPALAGKSKRAGESRSKRGIEAMAPKRDVAPARSFAEAARRHRGCVTSDAAAVDLAGVEQPKEQPKEEPKEQAAAGLSAPATGSSGSGKPTKRVFRRRADRQVQSGSATAEGPRTPAWATKRRVLTPASHDLVTETVRAGDVAGDTEEVVEVEGASRCTTPTPRRSLLHAFSQAASEEQEEQGAGHASATAPLAGSTMAMRVVAPDADDECAGSQSSEEPLSPLGSPLTPLCSELSAQALASRDYQIEKGKKTQEYRNYRGAVPLEARNRRRVDHPVTPERGALVSKRRWDGRLRAWRRALHAWDSKTVDDVAVQANGKGKGKGKGKGRGKKGGRRGRGGRPVPMEAVSALVPVLMPMTQAQEQQAMLAPPHVAGQLIAQLPGARMPDGMVVVMARTGPGAMGMGGGMGMGISGGGAGGVM